MKRIIALLLTLCLSLTAASALAETTRVDFGDFTLPLDESLLRRGDGSNSVVAYYFPCAAGGDTQSVMTIVANTGATDVTALNEEQQMEIAQNRMEKILQQDGVQSGGVVATIVQEINGVPFFMFNYYYIQDYNPGLAIIPEAFYEMQVVFSVNGSTYTISVTSHSHTVVENWFANLIMSIEWK